MFGNRIETNYGYKWPGSVPVVIVAPHAAGDDKKTSAISRSLAEELDAFVIVNRRFFKKDNHKAKEKPEFIEDFNKLHWSYLKNKYLWRSKKVAMKEFYDDIVEYGDQARKLSRENKAVFVYIHGIKNDDIGIDIGVGVKACGRQNKFVESFSTDEFNSGKVTVRVSYLKKIRKKLSQEIENQFGLKVTVGKKHIGWSKRSAIQFHKHEGRDDYAIQFEINPILRDKQNRDFLIKLLAESLRNIF